jgi:hypothetical protein
MTIAWNMTYLSRNITYFIGKDYISNILLDTYPIQFGGGLG